MKASKALITFLNRAGNNPRMDYTKVTVAEMKEFKDSCTPGEYQEFGRQAAAIIGEAFEE